MINETIFWEIIEKNKNNPINFKDETKNMTLEDMWEFYKLIEQMEKPWIDDEKVDKCWHSLYEQGICELSCDEIMFRGKEFYDAFINCNKEKIIYLLNKNPHWNKTVMTVETIQNIYGMKVANDEELEQINNGNEVMKYYCFFKFLYKVKNNIDLTIDDFLKERSIKLIEARAYEPSELYLKALDVKKGIQKTFEQYVPLYRQLCNREITKEEFINELKSQLENMHGVELQELNNLWKVVNGGYDCDTYCISNIIHLLIMNLFFQDEDSNDIDTFIYYRNK